MIAELVLSTVPDGGPQPLSTWTYPRVAPSAETRVFIAFGPSAPGWREFHDRVEQRQPFRVDVFYEADDGGEKERAMVSLSPRPDEVNSWEVSSVGYASWHR